jgi:hypothetical protein
LFALFLTAIYPFNAKRSAYLFRRALPLAGAVGIEPTQTVLETVVLPLYEAPEGLYLRGQIKLFRFFMRLHFFAVLAELFYFQSFLSGFLVFSGMVVDILANCAFQHYQVILGHCFPLNKF